MRLNQLLERYRHNSLLLVNSFVFSSFTLTFLVPQPTTVITTTATDIVYVGDIISLTCTVTLDSNIDSIVSVMIIWSGPVNINRYKISETTLSGNDYTSSLNINQLTERDQGTYTCLANVTGDYIVPTTGHDTYTLSKLSKTIAIAKLLYIFSSYTSLISLRTIQDFFVLWLLLESLLH